MLKIKSHSSVLDDPEDRKDGILEVGGEEISADEADPDYTEYMTGGVSEAEKCFSSSSPKMRTKALSFNFDFRKENTCGGNPGPRPIRSQAVGRLCSVSEISIFLHVIDAQCCAHFEKKLDLNVIVI